LSTKGPPPTIPTPSLYGALLPPPFGRTPPPPPLFFPGPWNRFLFFVADSRRAVFPGPMPAPHPRLTSIPACPPQHNNPLVVVSAVKPCLKILFFDQNPFPAEPKRRAPRCFLPCLVYVIPGPPFFFLRLESWRGNPTLPPPNCRNRFRFPPRACPRKLPSNVPPHVGFAGASLPFFQNRCPPWAAPSAAGRPPGFALSPPKRREPPNGRPVEVPARSSSKPGNFAHISPPSAAPPKLLALRGPPGIHGFLGDPHSCPKKRRPPFWRNNRSYLRGG